MSYTFHFCLFFICAFVTTFFFFTLCNTALLLHCSEELACIQTCVYVSVCGCVSDGECENSCFSEISRTEPEISTTFFCTHCTACHVFESNTCNLCYFLLLSVTGAGGIYKNSSSRQALTEFFSIVSKHRWIITPPPFS